MVYRTDDPLADFHRHCEEQEEWLKKRPKCRRCKEHIQDEKALKINGFWYCNGCVEEMKKRVDADGC